MKFKKVIGVSRKVHDFLNQSNFSEFLFQKNQNSIRNSVDGGRYEILKN